MTVFKFPLANLRNSEMARTSKNVQFLQINAIVMFYSFRDFDFIKYQSLMLA